MRILHVAAPSFPQFRFEWHAAKKIVYCADLRGKPVIGNAIAHNVDNHGAAQNAVLIWLRGYRAAASERMLDHASKIHA
ncbi:MAG: hypothetical protein AB7R90_19500 [Reyranellaceae bacterium]